MSSDLKLRTVLDLGDQLVNLLSDTTIVAPPSKSFSELYTKSLALQFLSNLRAALVLFSQRIDSEAWIVGRSMAELLIRIKWVQKQKSNASWFVLGSDLRTRNRFASQKTRSRLRSAAIAAVDKRFTELLPKLPKTGRFWSKSHPGRLRPPPNAEAMAKECGSLSIYRGFFDIASSHTHASHRVLERFMTLDSEGNFTGQFVLALAPNEQLVVSIRHFLSITCLAIAILKRAGWPVDDTRFGKLAYDIFLR